MIHRLFTAGLTLEGTLPLAEDLVVTRVRSAITDLDDTIREIRTVVFSLHRTDNSD
jgi:hypothetical protein